MAARPRKSAISAADQIAQLKLELAARIAEAEWLKTHYDRHLREALARVSQPELLPAQAMPARPLLDTAPTPVDDAELSEIHQEVERMRLAEKRYLDRIEELKEELAEPRGSERGGL